MTAHVLTFSYLDAYYFLEAILKEGNAMSKGQQHRVETHAIAGLTTVLVSGESIHTSRDAHTCAELLAEVLDALEYKGTYKVIASMQRLKGSSHLQGLSTNGVSINAVLFGYQPDGNNSRATYTLQLSNAEEAQTCFVVMKNYLGTAYNGKVTAKAVQTVAKSATEKATGLPSSVVMKSAEKLEEAPVPYYTSNTEWMETFVLNLMELSDQSGGCVSKDQVYDLIISHTHYTSRYGLGVIYVLLRKRGHIVGVEGMVDVFTVDGSPEPSYKLKAKELSSKKSAAQKSPKTNTKEKPKAKSGRKWYLNDEAWVSMCIAGLSKLVADKNGLLSHKDLTAFIQSNTEPQVRFGALGAIVKGLTTKGILYEASAKRYRFVYEPSSELPQKALAILEHAKAETAKVFDGFAKSRLPDFAEGMMANNKALLREFLQKVQDGVMQSRDMQKIIEDWYPGMHRATYIRLFNHLIGKGYLVRPNYRTYMIGPVGLDLLGLPAVTYTTVTKELPAAEAPPAELVIPATETVAEPTQKLYPFIPEKLLVTTANVPDVAKAAALVIAKATAKKAEADAVVEDVERLRSRRDELKAQIANGPSPEVVEAAFLRELVERANAL